MQEEGRLDRYPPTIRYLQKLGPEELDLIINTSEWILKEDPKMGLEVRLSLSDVEMKLIRRSSPPMNLRLKPLIGRR